MINITERDEFKEGIAFAYESILELIENQASTSQIEPNEFGSNNFEIYQIKRKRSAKSV